MTLKTLLTCSAIACILSAPAWSGGSNDRVKDWWIAGNAPDDYNFGVTSQGCVSGRCAFIKAKNVAQKGFGTLMQEISPDAYRGKRVRVSAMIKTEGAEKAQLWMRVDGPDGKMLSFYNMEDRAITGSTDWKRYNVVLDVRSDAVDIAFGYFLLGKGTAWADDFKLEPVGKDVPVSIMPMPKLSKTPLNMSFEQ